jgi:eukaryotic-like serine/threonine-protein kinase
MYAMAEYGSNGEGAMVDSLPWPERQPDFEHERVLAAAQRGLFDELPTTPMMIGRYRIDRRVGAGGMGEVYLGLDTELQRSVAIKLVLPHLHSARGPQRLRREALALARLSHPNVVQVYEVGEHQGRTFLAMELVEGGTLADWLAAGPPRSWREILERFVAAGRGLAAAHAAGIIHRDFKPENVSMTREGRVCVADFGLAWTEKSIPPVTRDEASEPAPVERLSTTGAVLGTMRYMPLEQLRGGPVDARADQ